MRVVAVLCIGMKDGRSARGGRRIWHRLAESLAAGLRRRAEGESGRRRGGAVDTRTGGGGERGGGDVEEEVVGIFVAARVAGSA